jgi:GGDEF domain-containing protein
MNTWAHRSHFDAHSQFERDREHDIIVRLDHSGFVLEASGRTEGLGIDLEAQLVMPHIADFADPRCRTEVACYFEQVVSGHGVADGIEFTVALAAQSAEDLEQNSSHQEQAASPEQTQRYNLKLSLIEADTGEALGAIGTLHPIKCGPAPARSSFTDSFDVPSTGLANRRCLARALSASIASQETVSVAIFAIDGMRSIFMQYGQGTADEIRWGFARFLEAMVEPHHTLTQIDDERFGVILSGMQPIQVREWAISTLNTFAGLTVPSKGGKPTFSASAGIARAQSSAEWTLRQAELGLVMARSAGGMQAAICKPHAGLSSGKPIEQAMESVVHWTNRRALR